MMKALESVDTLVVHHSASNPATTTVKMIKKWHTVDNGWADIGYHWIITADGKTHVGRPITRKGAHAPKVNSRSWGVCVVGDNTKYEWRWNADQEEALLTLIEAVTYLLPCVKVIGHRDTGQATECPGLDIATWLKGIL